MDQGEESQINQAEWVCQNCHSPDNNVDRLGGGQSRRASGPLPSQSTSAFRC
jgi:hypothetical protein